MKELLEAAPSPVLEIRAPVMQQGSIRLLLKRDDLRCLAAYPGDQAFGGNKWRKLQYNLLAARKEGIDTLLTFGGAYSNHIAAVASAGKLFGFGTVGIIRGDAATTNPTLDHALRCGMKLHFLDRSTYRRKNDPDIQQSLIDRFGPFFLLPEGGTNTLALQGCREYVDEIEDQLKGVLPDFICVPCGTGGTLAGIISGLEKKETQAVGFSILKGDFLQKEVAGLLKAAPSPPPSRWTIVNDYHFGGYARFRPPLTHFINRFKQTTGIPLDPVYTGKMLFALYDLAAKGYFPKGSTVLAIHTGGLQGIAGFNERFGGILEE